MPAWLGSGAMAHYIGSRLIYPGSMWLMQVQLPTAIPRPPRRLRPPATSPAACRTRAFAAAKIGNTRAPSVHCGLVLRDCGALSASCPSSRTRATLPLNTAAAASAGQDAAERGTAGAAEAARFSPAAAPDRGRAGRATLSFRNLSLTVHCLSLTFHCLVTACRSTACWSTGGVRIKVLLPTARNWCALPPCLPSCQNTANFLPTARPPSPQLPPEPSA